MLRYPFDLYGIQMFRLQRVLPVGGGRLRVRFTVNRVPTSYGFDFAGRQSFDDIRTRIIAVHLLDCVGATFSN